MHIRPFFALLAVFTLCLSAPARAEDDGVIGRILEVEGTATIAAPGRSPAPAAVDTAVHENDVIETGAASRAFVLFIDDTQLTLSENTKAKVDQYVFDPDNKAGNKARYSILQGTFLYLSGLIAKKENPDVRVETPYGAIGIRGTQFWGGGIDGGFGVLVLDGQVNVKNAGGEATLAEGMGTQIAAPNAAPGPVKKWPTAKVARATATVFLKRHALVKQRIAAQRRRKALRAPPRPKAP